MKIKKYLKNKKRLVIVAFAVIVVLGLLGGGVLYLAQSKNKEVEKKTEKADQEKAVNKETQSPENLKGKENVQVTTKNEATASTQDSLPAASSALLSDVFIQAIKNQDGTVYLSLYGPQGLYDVEKCPNYQNNQCPAGWALKVSQQSYPGHGGLPLETISSAEGNPSYLVYRVVNNQRVASSKPITITTSAIIDTKTFIGE